MVTYEPDALDTIDSLKGRPQFIRSIGQNSVMIPATIETLNSLKGFSVTGLLDCGATNGFINKDFVEKHHLDVEQLPLAVPVYNADGTSNQGGKITHVVHLQLCVQDHTDVVPFASRVI